MLTMLNGDEKNAFNEHLIDAVEKQRVLWDLQDRTYKSHSVCEAAWRRIAELGATGKLFFVSSDIACWASISSVAFRCILCR